jgi:hypothetical protein
MVETCLINPLSNVLIKEDWTSGDLLIIEDKAVENSGKFKYTLRRNGI